ncbi:MAG: hypothetical protein AAFY41_19105, partial [Bacteroidota bacterium]
TRIQNVKSLHKTIAVIEDNQRDASTSYKELTQQFEKYNSLLIGADAAIQDKLNQIESFGKQSIEKATSVQNLAKSLGSDKHVQEPELKEIVNYGVDGITIAELRAGTIAIWNFEEWARETKSQIIGGVALFKTMVKKYAEEIREKKKKIKKSQDIEIEIFPEELASQFDKYDPESTAEKLLKVEMYEARIMKQVDLQINPTLLDSALIGPQLAIYEVALADAKAMNLIIESVSSDDLELSKKKYTDYIESFFQEYVTVSKYVSDMQVWSRRQVGWLQNSVDYWLEENRWGASCT